MKSIRQLFFGLLSAIATSLLVLGAGTLAFVEEEVNLSPLSALATKTPLATYTTAPGLPTQTPAIPPTPTPTWVKFIQCNVPHGWQPYEVKPGDTLEAVAERFSITAEMIYQKNCLQSSSLPPGTILYLPAPTPTATLTPVVLTPTITPTPTTTPTPYLQETPCGPPAGWVVYVVRSGDTLYRLSVMLGVSQNALMEANCLTNPYLYAGQRLYVPFIPAAPATPTPTNTRTPTDAPVVPSNTPVTITPDVTVTPDLTATAAAEATNAANQTATAEAEATNWANQTATAEAEATNWANQTATAAANQTATAEAANQTATAAAEATNAANQTATSAALTATPPP